MMNLVLGRTKIRKHKEKNRNIQENLTKTVRAMTPLVQSVRHDQQRIIASRHGDGLEH